MYSRNLQVKPNLKDSKDLEDGKNFTRQPDIRVGDEIK